MKLGLKMLMLLFVLAVQGCGAPATDIQKVSCLGFEPPNLSIRVENALTSTVIENAEVWVSVEGAGKSQAVYYPALKDYRLADVFINEGVFSFTAKAEGFTFQESNNVEYSLDTSCKARNHWLKRMSLCPVGHECEA